VPPCRQSQSAAQGTGELVAVIRGPITALSTDGRLTLMLAERASAINRDAREPGERCDVVSPGIRRTATWSPNMLSRTIVRKFRWRGL
jgi:hypothetical protein